MDSSFDHKILKIFTLNCWGLRCVSAHRERRIKLIAQHLLEHNYDIVFLQEIWCQTDFDYIRTTTKSKYRFAHMFKNASILGTSGLVILTVWNPKVFHFHPFSVNGSPFRPFHGDWFTSKGVGYVRIELDSLNLHLFCTHMHAQYNENEAISDQYSVHRICQSYETAKFINLMTSFRSGDRSKTRDLIILAGDMNASSKELPYRLLVCLTELNDSYKCKTKVVNKINDGLNGGDCLTTKEQTIYTSNDGIDNNDDDMSDDDWITCGHRDNYFTDPKTSLKNRGKRIDFILFKLMDKKTKNGYQYKSYESNSDKSESIDCIESSCKVDNIKICCKDDSGLSFSDHQPVVTELKIYHFPSLTTSKNNFSELNSEEQTNIMNADKSMNEQNLSVISGNNSPNFGLNGDGHIDNIEMHDEIDFVGSGDGDHNRKNEISFNEDFDKCDEICLLTEKRKFKSNILLEITENGCKVGKSGPLQLKQIVSNSIKSKLESNVLDKNNLLKNTKSLLENYLIDNQLTLIYCLCLFTVVIISLSSFLFILLFLISMTTIEVLFLALIITIITSLSAFLKFLTHRHERNAVNAILNAIKKEISFN